MYLIGIRNNHSPAGNSGTIHVAGKIIGLTEFAASWGKMHNHDEVLCIGDGQYTQKLCEMPPSKFVEYIREIGLTLWKKGESTHVLPRI